MKKPSELKVKFGSLSPFRYQTQYCAIIGISKKLART